MYVHVRAEMKNRKITFYGLTTIHTRTFLLENKPLSPRIEADVSEDAPSNRGMINLVTVNSMP